MVSTQETGGWAAGAQQREVAAAARTTPPVRRTAHPVGGPRPRAAATAPVPAPGALRLALLSTFPPTQCGLATFTAALGEHLLALPGGGGRAGSVEVAVVRVLDVEPTAADLADEADARARGALEVVGHLVGGSPASARRAVELLDGFDAVVVQHEYGIFGGPDGIEVLDVVEALEVPVITVMHTVLAEPLPAQHRILARLLAASDVAVTMTETGRRRLVEVWGADPAGLAVIPHGAIDHAEIDLGAVDLGAIDLPDTAAAAGAPGTPGAPRRRPLVLTWGLLGPGKGVEWAVDAMPALRDLDPEYLVIGRTHPKVAERDGEAYRDGLRARVAERGVEDLVVLDDSYLELDRLAALVERADVVLLPYDSEDQVTSGVLIEAVAAGRPVVSTAFPHAVELLADGPGLLVPQRDPAAIAAALRRVLAEPGLAEELRRRAVRAAPDLLWSAVAERYRSTAAALVAARAATAGAGTVAS